RLKPTPIATLPSAQRTHDGYTVAPPSPTHFAVEFQRPSPTTSWSAVAPGYGPSTETFESPGSPFGPCGPVAPVAPFCPVSPLGPCGPTGPCCPLSDFTSATDKSCCWIVWSIRCCEL